MFRQHKDYRIRPFVSTRLPNKVSHVLSRQPQAPSSFWKLYCVYPMMTTKWLKERLLHKVIFSRETKVLIQTGCRERQTLWLPLGCLEAAELLFFSHSSVAFHIKLFRYVFSCTLFPKVRFPHPHPQIKICTDCWLFLKKILKVNN